MKKILVLISMIVVMSLVEISAQENAKLVIIRDTGTVNWLTNYSAFLNDDFIGKIPNKSFVEMEVEPGSHTFNFQFYGRKDPNPKRMKATMQMEAGKTYYVAATTYFNGFFYLPETLEITENSAKVLTEDLQKSVAKL